MAWHVFLEAVTDSPVPTDAFFITARFQDTSTSRVMRRDYKVQAGMTQADMKAPVLVDLQRLKDQDSLKTILTSLIGNEIT